MMSRPPFVNPLPAADRQATDRQTAALLKNFILISLLVTFMALLGILTRPIGLLAVFWPANAVLLGLLIRQPHRAHWSGWLAATLAFVATDVATGSDVKTSLVLTFGNLLSIATGFYLFRRLPIAHQTLRQPMSIVWLAIYTGLASVAAGFNGMLANPLLFQGTMIGGWKFWFTAEWVNYLAILPVILTMPGWKFPTSPWRTLWRPRPAQWRIAMPFTAVLLGLLLSLVFSGPGAIAYLVPGLLWCALSYQLFTTAVLTLLTSLWTLLGVAGGWLDLGIVINRGRDLESLRLGVTLIALAPLTVASVMTARLELLQKLQYLASHDPLTGVLNRSGFMEQAEPLFGQLTGGKRSLALMMLDIDFFKKINDQHGHAAGDLVLKNFALIAGQCLRDADLLGRIGGEEFVVLVPDCDIEQARSIAQRICDASGAYNYQIANDIRLNVTVSIGVVHTSGAADSMSVLLNLADQQLYQAKAAGRNQIVLSSWPADNAHTLN
ncbi:sensor domain-containing diguanylate cyclase [Rheinheimera riviphila]|uniref:diguanylate cyclase n=1 Tax=Rheinheimera riviphila TaxID=1834037 RepID=A0A437QBQ7_9GAMM|nr:GGDEF domain-containing protein [Rheinheimera riviphila]RVU31951.1 sensor domain-containing diguanylate cyclase [Rheinheimera riviphila]